MQIVLDNLHEMSNHIFGKKNNNKKQSQCDICWIFYLAYTKHQKR